MERSDRYELGEYFNHRAGRRWSRKQSWNHKEKSRDLVQEEEQRVIKTRSGMPKQYNNFNISCAIDSAAQPGVLRLRVGI